MKTVATIALIVLSMIAVIASGQDSSSVRFRQSVYIEVGATGGGISLNYERLFQQRSSWRYGARVGVGADYFSVFRPILNGELVALRGKKGHYLELGLGAAYFIPRRGERTTRGILTQYDLSEAVWLTPRIGYRRIHPVRGTLFRIGFTPPLILDANAVRFQVLGGISFGRSF